MTRIAILETGHPPEALKDSFDDYPARFRALLDQALADRPNAEAREGDGYALATAEAARAEAPLILIDPPFEKPDDYIVRPKPPWRWSAATPPRPSPSGPR